MLTTEPDNPQAILERSFNRIQEINSLMPAKTNDMSPQDTKDFHKVTMESDLKSL